LTTEDLRAYAEARANAEARKIELRKSGLRRSKAPVENPQSTWRNSML
jgi:hypothetical protein